MMKLWQKKLDAIYGTINGNPVVRVIWGQSRNAWHFNLYYKEWTPRYDWGFTEEEVADPDSGVITIKRNWFGLPRLILERAVRPQKTESKLRDSGGTSIAKPVPTGEIEYRLMSIRGKSCILVDHSITVNEFGEPLCCAERRGQGMGQCYGHYREMDESDFELFRHEEALTRRQSSVRAAELITVS